MAILLILGGLVLCYLGAAKGPKWLILVGIIIFGVGVQMVAPNFIEATVTLFRDIGSAFAKWGRALD